MSKRKSKYQIRIKADRKGAMYFAVIKSGRIIHRNTDNRGATMWLMGFTDTNQLPESFGLTRTLYA